MELPHAGEHSMAAFTTPRAQYHLTSPISLHQPQMLVVCDPSWPERAVFDQP